MRRTILLLPALALVAGGCSDDKTQTASPAPDPVRVGRPTPPKRISTQGPAHVELRAGSWKAMVLIPPSKHPHDTCAGVGEDRDPAEWDVSCDVSVRGGGPVAFVSTLGRARIFQRVVYGVAPPDVAEVRADGRVLPLSRHRGFLAVWPRRGPPIRLTSKTSNGATVSFRLSERRPHRHRRRGAIFNDEVGEPIMQLTRAQVIRRFGPPIVHIGRCDYYDLVGYPREGWDFCYKPSGRMASAGGRPPPRH